jgi:hypothetical protein
MKTNRNANLMPNGVPKWVRCYDNEGKTADRYTVCFTGRYKKEDRSFIHLGMSASPFHPQGIGQHGETTLKPCDVDGWGFPPMMGKMNHLGRRIRFKDLPSDCQKLVISDYKHLWRLE